MLVGQCVLLVAGLHDGGGRVAMPMMFALAMITLVELWIRGGERRRWAGACAFTGVRVVLYWPHFHPVLSTASLVVTTVPPVALGAYVRSVLRRAMDADRGREEAVRAARVAERTAIARELHDLVATTWRRSRCGSARRGAARAERLRPARRRGTGAGAHDHPRRAHGPQAADGHPARTRPAMADEAGAAVATTDGLPTALAAAVARARAAGVTVDADIDGAVATLDGIPRLAVLRVVQEGLTNVVKHADPTAKAALTVRVATGAVRIELTDDGPGTGVPRRSGFGLVGMRERVELLGGTVRTRRRSPGWSLEVTMPTGDQP